MINALLIGWSEISEIPVMSMNGEARVNRAEKTANTRRANVNDPQAARGSFHWQKHFRPKNTFI